MVPDHVPGVISPLFDTPTSSLGARVSNSVPGGPQPCNLGYVHTKPELSLSDLVSRNICVHNHETDTKPCSIHARPVCGAVILPQRYTKKERKTWLMRINLAHCIQMNMEQ